MSGGSCVAAQTFPPVGTEFPVSVAFVLANHLQVMGKVLGIVNRTISTYLRGPAYAARLEHPARKRVVLTH